MTKVIRVFDTIFFLMERYSLLDIDIPCIFDRMDLVDRIRIVRNRRIMNKYFKY